MAMSSWTTTAALNVLATTGINADEGMPPSAVNDSIREIMAVLKTAIDTGTLTISGNLVSGATCTAFAGATTLLTLGGTGATSVVAIPGTLEWSGTTGALTVAGGVYIAKKLKVVGDLTAAAISGTTGVIGGAAGTYGNLRVQANSSGEALTLVGRAADGTSNIYFTGNNGTSLTSFIQGTATAINLGISGVVASVSSTGLAVTGTLGVSTDLTTGGFVGIGSAGISTTFLNIHAGTVANSSLRVPHGSAPTSPVNGDMWTTTSGLYIQINGSTVGPLS